MDINASLNTFLFFTQILNENVGEGLVTSVNEHNDSGSLALFVNVAVCRMNTSPFSTFDF